MDYFKNYDEFHIDFMVRFLKQNNTCIHAILYIRLTVQQEQINLFAEHRANGRGIGLGRGLKTERKFI